MFAEVDGDLDLSEAEAGDIDLSEADGDLAGLWLVSGLPTYPLSSAWYPPSIDLLTYIPCC